MLDAGQSIAQQRRWRPRNAAHEADAVGKPRRRPVERLSRLMTSWREATVTRRAFDRAYWRGNAS